MSQKLWNLKLFKGEFNKFKLLIITYTYRDELMSVYIYNVLITNNIIMCYYILNGNYLWLYFLNYNDNQS